MCSDAMRLFCGSAGLCVTMFRVELLHSVFAHWIPPSMITFVAPVLRTALTSACMPTAPVARGPVHAPPALPSRQHCHDAAAAASVLSLTLPFGIGSLNRSKITCGRSLKRLAPDCPKLTEYNVFGLSSLALRL